MKIFSILLILAAFVLSAAGQERFVKPVDEASKDASFLGFRTKLISAVEKKDAKYILSIVAPDIKNGFGGEDGIVNFKKQWKIEQKDSEFWKEFSAVIKNGGSFIGEGPNKLSLFAAPYLFTVWPEDVDAFEHGAIFGTNVNLREEPNTESKVVAQLSYNIVKVDYENPQFNDFEKATWLKVETLGGKKGWVKDDFVRNSIEYRAGFEKKRGQWKMAFFLAGD